MEHPLISVIMPTHNRFDYAISSISSVLALDAADLQLVVTDTSSTSALEDALSNTHDSRLLYRHVAEQLSMTENHNLAMSLSSGEYVCLIGDDDSVSCEFVKAVRWAFLNGVDVLSPMIVANYAWPDFRSKYMGMSHAGRLYIKKRFGLVRDSDSKTGLRIALKHAVQGTDYLPKVYHGIVRKNLMDKIREESGAYFHGASPDVSGAVALALVSGRYVEIDYPLTIPGASGKSNTGRSALNKHKGTLKDDPHTKRFKHLEWPEYIPGFASVETVWAQAVCLTLTRLSPSSLESYNIFEVYSACLFKHPEYFPEVYRAFSAHYKKCEMSVFKAYSRLLFSFIVYTVVTTLRVFRRCLRPTAAGGRDFIPNLSTIACAQKALTEEMERRGISFDAIVASFFKK